MASTNPSIGGFRLVKKLNGGEYACNWYYVPSNDSSVIGVGDIVQHLDSEAGATVSDIAKGRMCVTRGVAGASTAIFVGVVLAVDQITGVDIVNVNHARKHRPASTGMYVLVCDDPSAIYDIQSDDDSETGGLEHVGSNADFVAGSGTNTTTGFSSMKLDTTSATTTATLPLKIVGCVNEPGHDISVNSTGLRYLVKINMHAFGGNAIGLAD